MADDKENDQVEKVEVRRRSDNGSKRLLQPTLYMNTYRLESKNPFNIHQVERIIKEVVSKQCVGLLYDPTLCPKLVEILAGDIRTKVKALNFERYKILVYVQIGEKKLQGFECGVRFLWDASRDRFATFSYENNTMFVTATCFGVYRE